MSLLANVGSATVGLILGLLAMFFSWRHNTGDRWCAILALLSGVLLAHSVAGPLSAITGLMIFGLSASTAIVIWGLTYTLLEGWQRIDFHAYRTLVIAFITGVCIGLTTAQFHLSPSGAGVLLVGEAAILAHKGSKPKWAAWFALLGGILLSTALIPQVHTLAGATGWSLFAIFCIGCILVAEWWISGHKQGPKHHEWLTPLAGFAGAVMIMVASGGAAHGFGSHVGNATLTAVNMGGSHGNLINEFFTRIANGAVTVAHKAGG